MTTAEASAPATGAESPKGEERKGMSTRAKILLYLGVYFGVAVLLYVIFGSDGKNEEFQPQEEFRLEPWIELKIGGLDLSFNKAVLYLLLTCVLTVGTMTYVARRMQDKPNRVQTIVEGAYDLTYTQITRNNMTRGGRGQVVPVRGHAVLLHLVLEHARLHPAAGERSRDDRHLRARLPGVRALRRHGEPFDPAGAHPHGVRSSTSTRASAGTGLVKYLKGWLPAGVSGAAAVPIFIIEVISQFVRIISLSVRLFANILAGHLLILFMGGGLAVLLGIAALGWITLPMAIVFFIFEVGLVATLQAFIFATLTSIYFGEATAGGH